jgi:hypothetical protein
VLDHLVYAVSDVDAGAAALADRLGVAPAAGGRHAGRGTHNALMSLGAGRYLEVIGPDPAQPAPPGPRRFGVHSRATPALAAWCARPADLDAALRRVRPLGCYLDEPVPMERTRPDGVVLRWRLAFPSASWLRGAMPFLIDWEGSPHPSADAPGGVDLVAWHVTHPEPTLLRAVVRALGEDVDVRAGAAEAVVATLRGRHGQVELT